MHATARILKSNYANLNTRVGAGVAFSVREQHWTAPLFSNGLSSSLKNYAQVKNGMLFFQFDWFQRHLRATMSKCSQNTHRAFTREKSDKYISECRTLKSQKSSLHPLEDFSTTYHSCRPEKCRLSEVASIHFLLSLLTVLSSSF